MCRPLSATWVTYCSLVKAVTVPLPLDVMWHGETSGNSYQSSSPGTPHLRYAARFRRSVSARLCCTVVNLGDQIHLTCSGPTAVTTPWSAGSVAQRPRRNILCFTNPETSHWVYYGSLNSRRLRRYWLACAACHFMYQVCHRASDFRH